jgi:FKBP-type peptidyl-prolyl cis-trans isomerase FklB
LNHSFDLMKHYLIVALFLISINVVAQKQVVKPVTNPAANALKLASGADSIQYALGMFVAHSLRNNGLAVNNPALFSRGMNDVMQHATSLLPDSIIDAMISNYQHSLRRTTAQQQEQQLFSRLRDKPGMGVIPNGVRYVVLVAGKGPRPSETDSILVHINAKLTDGTVVEDTYKGGKPFSAMTNSFFPGLNETLPLMPLGSKWQLFVPAALAYGENGTTTIPPYSALVLEVELLEIRPVKK